MNKVYLNVSHIPSSSRQQDYLKKFTNANTRPDSRAHHATRQTNVQTSILTQNSYGSSLVTIGNTKIITAITLQVGTPSPLTPSHGEIDVTVNFSPLCGGQYNTAGRVVHDDYEHRSVAANAYADPQSLQSFVKRTIISSNMIDLKQLCIFEGKAAWKIDVSCIVVNHDGNVVDAFLLGAVSALMDLTLPQVKMNKVDGQEIVELVASDEDVLKPKSSMVGGKKLDFQKLVVPLTIGFFGGKMLVDPTLEEESLCEGMITVVVDGKSLSKDDDVLTGDILNLSKSGMNKCSFEEIAACSQLAFGRAKELEAILES